MDASPRVGKDRRGRRAIDPGGRRDTPHPRSVVAAHDADGERVHIGMNDVERRHRDRSHLDGVGMRDDDDEST